MHARALGRRRGGEPEGCRRGQEACDRSAGTAACRRRRTVGLRRAPTAPRPRRPRRCRFGTIWAGRAGGTSRPARMRQTPWHRARHRRASRGPVRRSRPPRPPRAAPHPRAPSGADRARGSAQSRRSGTAARRRRRRARSFPCATRTTPMQSRRRARRRGPGRVAQTTQGCSLQRSGRRCGTPRCGGTRYGEEYRRRGAPEPQGVPGCPAPDGRKAPHAPLGAVRSPARRHERRLGLFHVPQGPRAVGRPRQISLGHVRGEDALARLPALQAAVRVAAGQDGPQEPARDPALAGRIRRGHKKPVVPRLYAAPDSPRRRRRRHWDPRGRRLAGKLRKPVARAARLLGRACRDAAVPVLQVTRPCDRGKVHAVAGQGLAPAARRRECGKMHAPAARRRPRDGQNRASRQPHRAMFLPCRIVQAFRSASPWPRAGDGASDRPSSSPP